VPDFRADALCLNDLPNGDYTARETRRQANPRTLRTERTPRTFLYSSTKLHYSGGRPPPHLPPWGPQAAMRILGLPVSSFLVLIVIRAVIVLYQFYYCWQVYTRRRD